VGRGGEWDRLSSEAEMKSKTPADYFLVR
jgi:hypothetical protein